MLVIAQHDVQDPDVFWSTAKEMLPSLPSTLKVHGIYPSPDLRIATCIWEAPQVSDVQEYLDNNVGQVSKNFCYEVNESAAVGLPAKVMEEPVTA